MKYEVLGEKNSCDTMGVATIIERKLRSTKVRLFTVPCCSIVLVSSECWEKLALNLLQPFLSFYNFCLCFILAFSPCLSHLPILSNNCVFYNEICNNSLLL